MISEWTHDLLPLLKPPINGKVLYVFCFFSSQSVCTVIVITCVTTWGKTKCMVLIFVLHRPTPSFKDRHCVITVSHLCHFAICSILFSKFEKFCKDTDEKKDPHCVSLPCSHLISWPIYQKSPDFMSAGSCVLFICLFIIYLLLFWGFTLITP